MYNDRFEVHHWPAILHIACDKVQVDINNKERNYQPTEDFPADWDFAIRMHGMERQFVRNCKGIQKSQHQTNDIPHQAKSSPRRQYEIKVGLRQRLYAGI